MKNPLNKRIFRAFRDEWAKYLALFLFLTATIAIISGFLIGSFTLDNDYHEALEKYNVEWGHFVLDQSADEEFIEKVEEEGVTVYQDFCQEYQVDVDQDQTYDAKLRMFKDRKEVNKVSIWEGKMPEKSGEIALDRLFMKQNQLEIGDEITFSDKNYVITACLALPDYPTMYWDNSGLMFDAQATGAAILNDEDFDALGDDNLSYYYEWLYKDTAGQDQTSENSGAADGSGQEQISSDSAADGEKQKGGIPADDQEEQDIATDLMEEVYKQCLNKGYDLEKFIPRYSNSSIIFPGDDIGQDRPMMVILGYILIGLLAFIFAVTIDQQIDQEACVIGTLRASGYTKLEILRSYVATPMLVILLAAFAGNILAYTLLKNVAANIYLASYSLTPFETQPDRQAFILTTVVPVLLTFAINVFIIMRKLKCSPLQFLRRDLKKKKRKKAVMLPPIGFMSRFRIRIILQNMGSYFTLLVGICFATMLLMFGLLFPVIMDKYLDDAISYMPCKYQYVVENAHGVPESVAEKYAVTSLETTDSFFKKEDISFYGIQENSRYFEDMELPEKGVVVASDFAKKYGVKTGDIICFKEKYEEDLYAFEVKGIYEYPTSMNIYMNIDYWNDVFADQVENAGSLGTGNLLSAFGVEISDDENYFNGYFSDEDLSEKYLRKDNIVNVVDEAALTTLGRQMKASMGGMMIYVAYFAVFIFMLVMYMLTRLILEKNMISISLTKILGYKNSEIAGLYIMSSVIVVVISSVISLAFNAFFFKVLCRLMFSGYSGWFNVYITIKDLVKMFVITLASYILIAVFQYIKIRRIPMDQALKNVE